MGISEWGKVLFIDDEEDVRISGAQTLEIEGFEVLTLDNAQAALDELSASSPAMVVTDVKMPGMNGMELLNRIVAVDPDLPVVLITGHGDVHLAVEAIRAGAYDFIEKPADPERLIDVVRRALEKRRLVIENRSLRLAHDSQGEMERRIIGSTPVMAELRHTIADLANTDVDVLIHGETGTGKELVARCLHDFGMRRDRRFVALNCGALPDSVIESELFGHEAGAFTGANKRRIGKIEYAEGGTLFLDEIESMPPAVQVRLLRVLQERTIERLGGNDPIAVDIRVITAAKLDLREAANDGTFREDLYYRLHVASVDLPALRDRREDIPLLFGQFAEAAGARFHRPVPAIDSTKINELLSRSWPGNVRELRNAAERFVLGMAASQGNGRNPGGPHAVGASEANTLEQRMADFERDTIKVALRDSQGRVGKAAEALGIPRKRLYLRMQKYGLNADAFKA
ncbi:sigma-54 dependent transcriptional regulator [Thalassospiraceae bacterium LMO-JJ14]|nr:sigma-54 dependent transcriptional regulator [Thalassospiraceae bacterium LMO-JJ14]